MKKLLSTIVFLCFIISWSQNNSEFRYEDKIRVNEAITISKTIGDSLWENFSKVPFPIVLITENTEFLIYHPNPSEDFKLLNYDSFLDAEVYIRKRVFSKKFLATFPAVNGLSCVVVGTPENTNKNSSEWIITLVHEHFHQYQTFDKNYYKEIDALNLSNGDQTGMWMLNYEFPYDKPEIINQYRTYSKELAKAVKLNEDTKDFKKQLKQYKKERKKFKKLLSESDYSYFSFQTWQEGIARYTEYKILELMEKKAYVVSNECQKLDDFKPFKDLKANLYENEMNNTETQNLNQNRRVSFYATGFAEGLLLDKVNKDWRNLYLKDKFFIEKYHTSQ